MNRLIEKTRSAFRIREFCTRNGISEFTYYRLRAAGLGPREMRMAGAVVRISAEAERDWQIARENPGEAEADGIAAAADRLKQRSQRAIAGGRA